MKSSPVARRRPGADRLVRHAPLRARAAHRQGALEAADRRAGARDAGGRRRRRSTSPAATSSSARCASPTARCCSRFRSAPTPARRRPSTATAPTSARSTTKCSRVDLRAQKIAWRYRDPDREFPYYSSAGARATARVIVGGRDKAVHAIDAATGKAAWKFVDPRARRFVARRRRRPRLRRIERRQALRARRADRRRSSGSSTPATRSPRRRPSPPAAWSSARRTAGSTVSVKALRPAAADQTRRLRSDRLGSSEAFDLRPPA